MSEEYKLPKNTPKPITPALVFGQLLQSRDIIHLVHLNSRIYSEHIILGDYYTKLLSLTDTLIETYQGTLKNGGRVNIIIPASEYCDPTQHFTSLKQYIQSHRNNVFSESNLQSIVDDIVTLIDKTSYLLSQS
jgi:hypothetical protein